MNVRMFLTDKSHAHGRTGRREKSDHPTVEAAKAAFAAHPNRRHLEAMIYVDATATWVGDCDPSGTVSWRPWRL